MDSADRVFYRKTAKGTPSMTRYSGRVGAVRLDSRKIRIVVIPWLGGAIVSNPPLEIREAAGMWRRAKPPTLNRQSTTLNRKAGGAPPSLARVNPLALGRPWSLAG